MAAVVGNFAVMVVLLSSRFKMTVSKFLMCNLAFADFCMGIYLFLIAVTDLRTEGKYFNYAIDWQEGMHDVHVSCLSFCSCYSLTGIGCQIAGFVTVFASELSIFTLTVITLERWCAITYAIHLDRRLKLGTAGKIMIIGWFYAAAMATLPLVGVSGYSTTSICLPMDHTKSIDIAYLVILLTVNAAAFILICCCYAKVRITLNYCLNVC